MNVSLRHLRAAVGVARLGSFRRAAESVHLSQPALSLTIAELEQALGVTLFDRTSRSVHVTELGEAFVHGAVQVLGDFERLVQEVGDVARSRRGRVVVSCTSSLAGRVVPLALRRCARTHPEVEVIVRDDVAVQVLAAVRSREADFGLTMGPTEAGADVVFEALHQDRFHVVVQRTHRLARRRRVGWRDLDGETLVTLSTSSGIHRLVEDELVRQRVKPGRSTPVSHLSTVHGMLEAGYGIALLPAIALPVARHPTLVARPLVGPDIARTIGVYRRRDRSLSPAAATFLDAVREALREFGAVVPHRARARTARQRRS
jgi:DNA-binding transcriptional LysR family regulator